MYRQPCKRNEMIAVESRYSTLEHLLGNPFSFLVVLIKHRGQPRTASLAAWDNFRIHVNDSSNNTPSSFLTL